jgi:hypothetical protein
VLDKLDKGEMVEISTGLFTDNIPESGVWNGEAYTAVARNYRPDHLAILPDQKGSCSIADGAGLLRNKAKPGGTGESDQGPQAKSGKPLDGFDKGLTPGAIEPAVEFDPNIALGEHVRALADEREDASTDSTVVDRTVHFPSGKSADASAVLRDRGFAAVGGSRLHGTALEGGVRTQGQLGSHGRGLLELEEALAWHVARVQNLEAESPRRLVQRALGRAVHAFPLSARFAARLHRRRAGPE